jgi:hypothetical protein
LTIPSRLDSCLHVTCCGIAWNAEEMGKEREQGARDIITGEVKQILALARVSFNAPEQSVQSQEIVPENDS